MGVNDRAVEMTQRALEHLLCVEKYLEQLEAHFLTVWSGVEKAGKPCEEAGAVAAMRMALDKLKQVRSWVVLVEFAPRLTPAGKEVG